MKNYPKIYFRRFLFTFLLILTISIVAGNIILALSLKILENRVVLQNRSALEKSMLAVERRLNQFVSSLIKISSDISLRKMLYTNRPLDGTIPYYVGNAWRDARNYFSEDLMFVYFLKPDLIFSYEMIHTHLNRFYGLFFTFGGLDLDAFREKILTAYHYRRVFPVSPFTFSGREIRALSVASSLPMEIPESEAGLVISFFPEDEIAATLRTPFTENDGWSYILDAQDTVLLTEPPGLESSVVVRLDDNATSNKFQTRHDGMRVTVMYEKSKANDWTYVSVVPSRTLLADVFRVRRIIISVIIALLLAGFGTGLLLARRYSLPVAELVKGVSLRDQMLRQQNLDLRRAYIKHLIGGGIHTQDEFEECCRHLGLSLAGESYQIALVYPAGYDRGNSEMGSLIDLSLVIKLLNQSNVRSLTDIDRYYFTILFINNTRVQAEVFRNAVKDAVQNVIAVLRNSHRLESVAAIGGVAGRMEDIPRSFSEARQVFLYNSIHDRPATAFLDSVPQVPLQYHFSFDTMLRLTTLVKGGNIEATENLLVEIYLDNTETSDLPQIMFRQLAYDLRGTAIKLANEIFPGSGNTELSRISAKLFNSEEPEHILDLSKELISFLVLTVDERKGSHNLKLIKDIMDFIDEHYSDNALGLTLVADKFQISESYLSRFFKEQTGKNFSRYIEDIRIRIAQELLSDTDDSIEAVAHNVGYNSGHVFRKVFKKDVGMTPYFFRNQSSNQQAGS